MVRVDFISVMVILFFFLLNEVFLVKFSIEEKKVKKYFRHLLVTKVTDKLRNKQIFRFCF